MDQRWARPWFALTAACVATGIITQLIISARSPGFFGGSPLNRALNVFAFFTIQSNLIVGGTCLLLALDPGRRSTLFATLRLTGLIAITVTFVVFHVALSRLLDLDTWGQVANQLQHTVVPVLAVVGWLVFGPRERTSKQVARSTVIFPLTYMVFTAIRGPLASDWYPYPFANVHALGYPRVAVNALWISLLFVGLAAAATALDGRLPRVRSAEAVRSYE
ncbi:MAG TPA: Pr6Pr family membrane protein [Jatrophihabitans sp.]|jgi:hypothetical protein|uniref:Pr6Pr family membrane protein n=1 Tax=Jatrophihabitans sp. TaxID=1932789 RepID=UPI002E0306F7|nr:Pr6Pr family membrane protein [Jatrophihabitans sp.]